ncbi:sigma-70 family RNA polymerase sigma factor [Flammeovirgaceae bacterium SG7u.111]|nr:sigma-70 family RNA polymerase sigma factor [Flammeovirgaceae bacterium SG7u.132]WPO33740.1 sigma-70 family RNA polymerase sigma factor [Flammeovirgaceae bacterium SG7u.111]
MKMKNIGKLKSLTSKDLNFTTQGISKEPTRFSNMDDQQIWSLFKKGDDEALCYIYRVYAETLYRFGCQITNDQELVKDAIQDIFVFLKRNGKKTTDVLSIKSYLYRSLHRSIHDKLKQKNRFFLKDTYPAGFDISISTETKMVEKELYEEKVKFLEDEINKLTSKQKQAIVHYYYEGFTYQEVAYIMGLADKDSARKLIYRGLDAIKVNLKKYKHLLLPVGLLLIGLAFQNFF